MSCGKRKAICLQSTIPTPTKLDMMMTSDRGSAPIQVLTLWSRAHVWSCDTWKMLYLFLHKASGSIKWSRKKHWTLIYPLSPGLWPPNRTGWLLKLSQVKPTFGHVVAWDYVANENCYIHFLGPKVMSTKPEWEWLYERLLSKKVHDLLVVQIHPHIYKSYDP